MAETVFAELKRYVRFGDGDERALRALHAIAAPRFDDIATVFYDRILSHDEARAALVGGESQVGHLKITLKAGSTPCSPGRGTRPTGSGATPSAACTSGSGCRSTTCSAR